ncbi:MAG: chromosomal replication initiator protein DnaA [Clostridia bacterium]|nr:chromosomal replication initiator protein DnaA [Clostridia bacterium]
MDTENRSEIQIIGEMLEEIMHTNYIHSEQSYELWFGRLQLRRLDSDEAFFVCENELKRKIITEKFTDYIADCLSDVIGYKPKVTIGVDTSLAPVVPDDGTVISPLKILRERQAAEAEEARRAELEKEITVAEVVEQEEVLDMFSYENSFAISDPDEEEDPDEREEARAEFDVMKKDHSFVYNEDYTFEKFVVSESNSFAHAAAINVAENVGMKINPLFIYGSSGLGKTHLMYAIANRAKQRFPKMNIICMKGEEFMTELIEAIKKGTQKKFREKYRGTDMLLLDDIQFLAGKEATQNEFFHTFDALYEDHKQIIITSDRPPRDLISLADRIRSRFEAGLLCDIKPPDYELRLAILQNKISESGIDVPHEVVDFLAKNLQENVRQLEGVIKKLAVSHLLTGQPITMDMVIRTVPEYLKNTEPVVDTMNRIVTCVATHYSVPVKDIIGDGRPKNIATARNVSMYIIRAVTNLPLKQIGQFFNNRNHATVHSNISAIEKQIQTDTVLDALVSQIMKEVKRD